MLRPFTLVWALTSVAVLVLFSVSSAHALTYSLDAATAAGNGVFEDDLLAAGSPPSPPPLVLSGAAGLPLTPPPPPPADVDGFSFGHHFPGLHTVIGVEFSVAPGSIGAAGTALVGESAGLGFADEPADIYASAMLGGNTLIWDGDGTASPGAPLIGPMGVFELGPPSNVDGWDATAPFGALPSGPGIHYTVTAGVAIGHPVYAGSGATGAHVFFSPPVVGYSVAPALYATDLALGLGPGDEIDALAIVEDGILGFTAGDTVYFSLAPGSPTLGALAATPGDILATTTAATPGVAVPHFALGLLPGDDVDALDLIVVPEPTSAVLLVILTTVLLPRQRRD